jgi:hypothetical protein
LNLIHKKH